MDLDLGTRREGRPAGTDDFRAGVVLLLAVLLKGVEVLAVFLANVAQEPGN